MKSGTLKQRWDTVKINKKKKENDMRVAKGSLFCLIYYTPPFSWFWQPSVPSGRWVGGRWDRTGSANTGGQKPEQGEEEEIKTVNKRMTVQSQTKQRACCCCCSHRQTDHLSVCVCVCVHLVLRSHSSVGCQTKIPTAITHGNNCFFFSSEHKIKSRQACTGVTVGPI